MVYSDVLSNDEIFTDTAKGFTTKHNGAIFVVPSRMVSVGGEEYDIGANASAEGGGEILDDSVEQVLNLVRAHSLKEMGAMGKSVFSSMNKKYFKALKNKFSEIDDEKEKKAKIDEFKKSWPNIQAFMKEVKKDMKSYTFFTSENGDIGSCMPIPAYYEEGASAPTFFFYAIGSRGEKN